MEITVKGQNIKLKKDYLTNIEVNFIITEALSIYNEAGDIDGYDYNPISMITNFYAMLFSLCIEDYDIEDTAQYDKYYNLGTQYELLRVVTNADEAYHLMMSISKEMSNVSNIISKNLNKILAEITSKMPDSKDMAKLLENMPTEWNDVYSQFQNIIGANNDTVITKEED